MYEWSDKIDEKIGPLVSPSTLSTEGPKPGETIKPSIVKKEKPFKRIPIIKRKLTGKEKFSIEVASILQFCDGKHSIEDIRNETKYSIITVKEVLKEYQKKDWIKFKKIIQ